MYLMNVPPVAATQTEWRRCGPPGGFSLPVCFNDSDTELSTRDTPISDKVQMIIDSLRSTQSSLDMGDEVEGSMLPGQDGCSQACVGAVGSYMEKKSKAKSPPENQQMRPPSANHHESSDSDSDDSVDRGIEEAILEYLKEKDDHKRKADSSFLHSSKIPRQHPPILGIFKHSDSHSPLISCNQIPRMIKAETVTTPTTIPLKKYLKNKASLDENFNLDKSPSINLTGTNESIQTASNPTSIFNKTTNSLVTFKAGDDTTDSSSDDGIEEAIQKYQLEKRGQQNRRETFAPPSCKEESDSTSDDGIEEAIRCYQLEQQKEKHVLKPFLDRQTPLGKPLEHSVGGTSSESTSKLKLKKKHSRADKQARSFSNDSLSAVVPKHTLSQSSKGKGNGLLCLRPERFEDPPTYTPPKVNTTAELMCAEAILDISKTVMPGAFHHSLGMNSCGPTKSSEQPPPSNSGPLEESEDSSIDSEDGIEQEIRKFLEQKAQMHKQPPGSQNTDGVNEAEKLSAKEVQKKPQRLSLTQRRKQKVLQSMSGTDDDKKSLLENAQVLAELPCRGAAQAAMHKTDRGGDKSSSLDSDEDLDTAIKDLLKTKKKSKKKIRDLKRKPRKCIRDEEPSLGNSLPTKKFKSESISRSSTLTKAHKQKDEMKDELGLIKKNVFQQKHTDQSISKTQKDAKELLHIVKAPPQEKDDSSSVDSDDSIEQEIRKFLAEKAKVSTMEKTKDGDVSRNGTVIVQGAGIKQEPQLAEVSSKSPPLGSLSSQVSDTTPQRLQSVISPASTQPRASLLQPCTPCHLEPADGAGAARVEQEKAACKQDTFDVSKTVGRGRPMLSPNLSHSSAEANKWRQSLGLPLFDTKGISRTPFLINTSDIKGTPASTFSNQNKGPKMQTSAGSWFASKTGRAPASCSKETGVNPTVRPPVLNFYSAARQHPTMSFAHNLLPSHSSQFSVGEEKASTVHVPKDKSVFVELETNRTNHVQVQSRERHEGNERAQMLNDRKAEDKSMKIEVSTDRREEEEFVDETDCESDGRKDPGKKQGFSALSLCRAIDPGISISPCIALTTEERSRISRRRYLVSKYKKGGPSIVPLQLVKRKLVFVADGRKKETPYPSEWKGMNSFR